MAANFDGKSTFFSNSFLSPSQTLKFNVSTVKVPIFVYNFPPTQLEIRRRFKGKRSRLPRLCRPPPPPDPATSQWNAETVADGQDSTRGCGRHLLLARQPRSRLKSVGRISRRVRGVLVTITYKYNNNFCCSYFNPERWRPTAVRKNHEKDFPPHYFSVANYR